MYLRNKDIINKIIKIYGNDIKSNSLLPNNNINNLDDLYNFYQLTNKEHDSIFDNISKIMLSNKSPVNNPILIINIAPPGSGKTGLNGMYLRDFENNNAIIINGDELKAFHLKTNEIEKLYPEHYAKIINNDSNPWNDDLFDLAIKNNYNVIFEGTWRNLKLMHKMIEKSPNHLIIIRGLAVNEANSLMSILERYRGQILTRGWCRIVSIETYYKTYLKMLENIHEIERTKIADIVEVYIRADLPSNQVKIYETNSNVFESAKSAVEYGRKNDKDNAINYFKTKFENKLFSPEEKDILEKLNSLLK